MKAKNGLLHIIALFMALIMLIGVMPMSVIASEVKSALSQGMNLTVSSVTAMPGETVEVTVSVTDNPGIASLKFDVEYDSVLTLTNVVFNTAFGTMVTAPTPYRSPQPITMISPLMDTTANGVFATLTFVVGEDAADGYVAGVNVTFDQADIFNGVDDEVKMNVVNGEVAIFHGIPGDINGDKTVNTKDAIALFRYVSGWSVDVDHDALDVNGDGNINTKDAIALFRYVAGWEGIVLHRGPVKQHEHDFVAVEAKNATCTESGNIAYWYCNSCGKYYTEKSDTSEITLQDTVVEALGHTVVIDPPVAPTTTSTGLTEGSHCSVCEEVLVKQEVIDKIEGYSISYYPAHNDLYLAQIEIEHNNPNEYVVGKGVSYLEDPVTDIPGYTFVGWTLNGQVVTSISAEQTGNLKLYGKWEKSEYTITYVSDVIEVEADTYTVDSGSTLYVPKYTEYDGYIFAGWSDENGEIVKKIPAGSIGHKTYTANWLSERNLAWTKTNLDDPLVYEDDQYILFTYEIGEIRNVPLYLIHDFGKVNANGVSKTVTKTYSTTVLESLMETYTDTIAKATTDSYGWNLSNGWTESVSVNEEWAEENGLTTEEAQSICTTESGDWYVSNGSSGSSTSYTLNTEDKYKLVTSTNNDKSYENDETESKTNVSAELNADIGVKYGILDVGVSANVGTTMDDMVNIKTGWSSDDTTTDEESNASHHESSQTNSASWNSASGYSGSNSTSNSQSITQSIAKLVSQKYQYGTDYIKSEDTSSSMGHTSSEESTKQYSSSVVYTNEVYEEITETYTTENTMKGYHRWVMAGTAHVFAVVGYDIATESYFVYNFSVMDDEMHEFEDYSFAYSSYDDNQNGVIEFEAPTDIMDYVAERTTQSDGLEVSKSGVVTGYTGEDDFVIVPEYKVINNLDGTNTVVKITSISADAFKGNIDIEVVVLSDFITEIPDGAFENCTALEAIYGENITKIGNNAFSGCVSIKKGTIGERVTSLGSNVFADVESISVTVSNASVLKSAVESGAKNITIDIADSCNDVKDISINVPETVDTFIFNGYGKEFNDTILESKAAITKINRASFISSGRSPLVITSDELTMQEVTAYAPGMVVCLCAETTNVILFGESTISSEKENAMLSKNIVFTQYTNGYHSKLIIAGNGNLLINGSIENSGYLSVGGQVKVISEEEFDKYKNGSIKITFDANGGTVSELEKEVFYGQTYGELPIPSKENYGFAGWYTEPYNNVDVHQLATEGDWRSLNYMHYSVYAEYRNRTENSVETRIVWTNTIDANYYYAQWQKFNANIGGTSINDTTICDANEFASDKNFSRSSTVYSNWVTVSLESTNELILDLNGSYWDGFGDVYEWSGSLTIPAFVSENSRIDSDTIVGEIIDQILYAHWTANSVTVVFDANGGSVETLSKDVSYGSNYGELPIPTKTGYTFDGWYNLVGERVTSETIQTNDEDVTLTAKWKVNSYNVSWNTGTGYTITVKRTDSPNACAPTGTLSNGDTVYYGDTLSVTYSADKGYSISSKGSTSITVSGNITSSNIYAKASLNSYTYNVVYKSSNGTTLGSTTATYNYGTTNTISAPWKSGYDTPGSQTVKWDSTSAKTITFIYSPSYVNNNQWVSGSSWRGLSYLNYSVNIEYRNRTANSVEVRVIWTNTINANYYFGQYQAFNASIGGSWLNDTNICSSSEFGTKKNYSRSVTKYSDWITVSLGTTNQTTVSLYGWYWDGFECTGEWSGSFTVAAY